MKISHTNNKGKYILAFDIGSSGIKVTVYDYSLQKIIFFKHYHCTLMVQGNRAENDPQEWWGIIKLASAEIKAQINDWYDELAGISFCSQLQAVVLTDRQGNALLPSMNYLDARAHDDFKQIFNSGLLKIQGLNLPRLLPFLYLTSGAPVSAKDPIWKYLWAKKNHPEIFSKVYKWFDAKDYLIFKLTGEACTTPDAAHLTFLCDLRNSNPNWSKYLCQEYGVDLDHLPRIQSGEIPVGPLSHQSAQELGLPEGVPVFGGGGDVTCLAIGAGAGARDKGHIYIGTSAWVGKIVGKKMLDIDANCAALKLSSGCDFTYMGELPTGGVCLKWGADQLLPGSETNYQALEEMALRSPAGAKGAMFLPWLQGTRSPKENPLARGGFHNLSLANNRDDLARSLFEGVAIHLGWLAQTIDHKTRLPERLRFVGGGALSPLWAQILADVFQRPVETPELPSAAGSLGATMVAICGLGPVTGLCQSDELIPAGRSFEPDRKLAGLYRERIGLYAEIFKANQPFFSAN